MSAVRANDAKIAVFAEEAVLIDCRLIEENIFEDLCFICFLE